MLKSKDIECRRRPRQISEGRGVAGGRPSEGRGGAGTDPQKVGVGLRKTLLYTLTESKALPGP